MGRLFNDMTNITHINTKPDMEKKASKNPDDVIGFFQRLIDNEGFRAYSAEFDVTNTLKETDERIVVEVLKGATLISLDKLQKLPGFNFFLKTPRGEAPTYFVSRRSNRYSSQSGREGNEILFVDFLSGFKYKRIRSSNNSNEPWAYFVPSEMVTGRLELVHWNPVGVHKERGICKIYGNVNDRAGLFSRLVDYLGSDEGEVVSRTGQAS